jgi:hypothetical protein
VAGVLAFRGGDTPAAEALQVQDAYVLPYTVVDLGGASARGDHEDVARLLAAAMFDRTGAALDPGTAIEFELHVERTRAALGVRFEDEWDGGYALDDEHAISVASGYR